MLAGLREAERFDAGPRPRAFGQHRVLDLARHFEIALERQAIGDLEQHEQVHQQEPGEQRQRAVARSSGAGTRMLTKKSAIGIGTRIMPNAVEELQRGRSPRRPARRRTSGGAPATGAS